MSRTVRRQLIEILNTLKEANKLLESLLGGGQEAEIVNLLAGCQNCAITMGNKIEAVYGAGTASVHALEEYCEIIFQLSENIQNQSEGLQIYEKMKEQLLVVEENMEQEIPDKQEVVFMPYKASMWDALESVYLAAKEDESCEAYVVPIPYFDLNSDRSFGEMHYEGNEYPKNIEVIDWQSYNLEARMPDVIYIHNPYDDWNRVTSVHPKFYSSNLKKYTEKLVYIPYFVLQEIEPDDQAAIDQVKHFFFLPGIINADRVIVQSEKMKQIYINEYLKGAKAFGLTGAHLDRKKLEEKFLGLGSPKFDKVLNTRREDLEIPEEWLKIIEKPDGTWKKIIFYNTSITALLQYDVKMLEKMKYVFHVFKEQQEEVALLWRPHPLIPSTIKSMRPHLWEEYEKIVEEYKRGGWGIYDDTADMDRAVSLSDAYYGDGSSVAILFEKTKRHIIIQKMEKQLNSLDLFFSDAEVIDNEIWFAANNINGLFKRNLTTGEVELLGMFPDEKLDGKFLYSCINRYKDELIFTPFQAKNICVYNMNERKFHVLKLPAGKRGENYSKFYTSIQEDKMIYMLPCRCEAVVRYNAQEREIQVYDSVFKHLGEYTKYFGHPYAFKGTCKVGTKIYIASYSTNVIEEFDIVTEKATFFMVPECDLGITHLLYEEGKFWIIGCNGNLVIWDRKEFEIIRIDEAGGSLPKFYDVKYIKGKIYFTGTYSKKIYEYDIAHRRTNYILLEMTHEKKFSDFYGDSCSLIKMSDNCFGTFNLWDGKFHIYNLSDLKEEEAFIIKNTSNEVFLENIEGSRRVLLEACGMDTKVFGQCLPYLFENENDKSNVLSTIGNLIYYSVLNDK